MITFKRKVALKIAMVSLTLASIASPLAWYVSRENAEKGIVSFAIEESHRLLMHRRDSYEIGMNAEKAARTLVGGLFEIAEIYDSNVVKLAEAMTAEGQLLEHEIQVAKSLQLFCPVWMSLRQIFLLNECRNRWLKRPSLKAK